MNKTHFQIFIFVLVLFFYSLSGCTNLIVNPEPIWDTSPDYIVITYERRYETDYNFILPFRVWGDGYIVWVEYTPDGRRKVFDGYISKDELNELLEGFIDAGFFKDCNKNQSYALDYIRINLADINCSGLIDSSNTLNANYKAISDLVSSLMAGLGTSKKEFIPTVGFLYVVPYEKTEYYQRQPTIQPKIVWPAEKFGYEIKDIPAASSESREKEITGDELLFAWEVVNSPEPFVESKGDAYWIAVIIPKISEVNFGK